MFNDFALRVFRWRIALYLAMIVGLLAIAKPWNALAQSPAAKPAAAKPDNGKPEIGKADEADKKFADAMAAGPSSEKPVAADKARAMAAKAAEKTANDKRIREAIPDMDYWEMFRKGGMLMYPIAIMSVIAVAFGVERMFGLRRSKLVPRQLVEEFGELSSTPGGMDLKRAYRICQKYPSAAANVIRAMLLKAGRPLHEVERATEDASAREAVLMFKNVRPLVLTVTVTPLMGLLGTVAGMITAFYVTANMPPNEDKATWLADGIYVKLLTTFAGLIVAIPALILAHWYEGRIALRRREIDELAHSLLPQIERFEGKLRVNRAQLAAETSPPKPPAPDARRQTVPSAAATHPPEFGGE